MKIRIEQIGSNEEEEIVIRARKPDTQMMASLVQFLEERDALTGYYADGSITRIKYKEIYYFESVENRVFAYGVKDVAELKCRLYELEERFSGAGFIRISKSMILNLSKVERFIPVLGGRIEALLKNGERVVISRQYVPEVKRRLGLYVEKKTEKDG